MLYQKYRPQAFEEVKGQEHIVKTIKNQVLNNRVGHAYLFTGTRGTGKTTMARLLGKAVNCMNPLPDGSPCCQCEACKQIDKQASLSFIELDAASHNGVDDIREINDNIKYPPVGGLKKKIYIIDEAHMLTASAENALLKTLEEPPEYVIFVLATTDPQKISATILSRCQRYNFHRVSNDVIQDNIKNCLTKEGISWEDKAIDYISRKADGSIRDSLSILEQCIQDGTVSYENTVNSLGAIPVEKIRNLVYFVTNSSISQAMDVIEEISIEGVEYNVFVEDLIAYLRDLMFYMIGKTTVNLPDSSFSELEAIKETTTVDFIMDFIQIMNDYLVRSKTSDQKRVELEIALIKAVNNK